MPTNQQQNAISSCINPFTAACWIYPVLQCIAHAVCRMWKYLAVHLWESLMMPGAKNILRFAHYLSWRTMTLFWLVIKGLITMKY